jgi:hypothetical protein
LNNQFIRRAAKTIAKREEIPEVDIEDHYVAHAKSRKCKALKLVYLRKKGFPDRTTLCRGGRILFIEFKRKGKKPTKLQALARKLLRSFGFEYHVCDKIGQAEQALDEFISTH